MTPVRAVGPCVWSTTRSAENQRMLVDELERRCLLTYTKEKEERERKLAFNSGVITLFDLFVSLINRWLLSVSVFGAC